jgi:hypothetical protein
MITIPNKYNISRDEWVTIRAQLLVLGCPTGAVPKRYTTLKHRLAVISTNTVYVHGFHRYSSHLALLAQWLNENNLVLTHHAYPNRYHIGRV